MSSRLPPDQQPYPITPGSPPEGPEPRTGRPNAETAWFRTFIVSAVVFAALLVLRVLVAEPDGDEVGVIVGYTLAPAVICFVLVGLLARRSRRRWTWWAHVGWVVGLFLVLSLLVATGENAGRA